MPRNNFIQIGNSSRPKTPWDIRVTLNQFEIASKKLGRPLKDSSPDVNDSGVKLTELLKYGCTLINPSITELQAQVEEAASSGYLVYNEETERHKLTEPGLSALPCSFLSAPRRKTSYTKKLQSDPLRYTRIAVGTRDPRR